jgi:hypothetical protein
LEKVIAGWVKAVREVMVGVETARAVEVASESEEKSAGSAQEMATEPAESAE